MIIDAFSGDFLTGKKIDIYEVIFRSIVVKSHEQSIGGIWGKFMARIIGDREKNKKNDIRSLLGRFAAIFETMLRSLELI